MRADSFRWFGGSRVGRPMRSDTVEASDGRGGLFLAAGSLSSTSRLGRTHAAPEMFRPEVAAAAASVVAKPSLRAPGRRMCASEKQDSNTKNTKNHEDSRSHFTACAIRSGKVHIAVGSAENLPGRKDWL